MATRNLTIRFRNFELDRIDDLAHELGYTRDETPVRADVIRAALDLLRRPESRDYRRMRRVENVATAAIDRLRDEYGRDARAEVAGAGEGEVRVTIGGREPAGLRAQLTEVDGHPEAAALVLIAESSLTGEDTDLALSAGLAYEREEWQAGVTSLPLSSLYPRADRNGMSVPLREPTY